MLRTLPLRLVDQAFGTITGVRGTNKRVSTSASKAIVNTASNSTAIEVGPSTMIPRKRSFRESTREGCAAGGDNVDALPRTVEPFWADFDDHQFPLIVDKRPSLTALGGQIILEMGPRRGSVGSTRLPTAIEAAATPHGPGSLQALFQPTLVYAKFYLNATTDFVRVLSTLPTVLVVNGVELAGFAETHFVSLTRLIALAREVWPERDLEQDVEDVLLNFGQG
ncbi:hypothetical protein BCR34DRAFT_608653 [Clohesyomyces aquaticus]|uniref:Uncharacterized protein n=1 Tax=Clohesyomyces aquaticus TaxID=1231657 RepID=A0A1Y1Y547_9PLEO|nr:hypothetical protein BCR34DRAFT_608653 [Clohesyomyces aquaticus]